MKFSVFCISKKDYIEWMDGWIKTHAVVRCESPTRSAKVAIKPPIPKPALFSSVVAVFLKPIVES